MQFKRGKAITKSQDDYSGPMLRFVLDTLRVADRQFAKMPSRPSEQQVGRELYFLCKRVNLHGKAARERLAPTVEEICSANSVIVRQVLRARPKVR